jgi:hypothetical protein
MRQSLWVIYHVAGALAAAGVVSIAWLLFRRWPTFTRYLGASAILFCAGVLAWLGVQSLVASWRVVSADINDSFSLEVGQFARAHLPDDAVLLCEERKGYEHLTIMFYADRTCYALAETRLDEMAERILQANGTPYVVSYRKLAMPSVHVSERRGPTVYRWQPN